MEQYSLIIKTIARLMAWWLLFWYGYPQLPEEPVRLILLGAATLWLLFTGFQFNREHRYFPTMFTWALALAPWAFYGEWLWLIQRPATDHAVLSHAVLVYNLFRYVLQAFVLIIIVRIFFEKEPRRR